MKLDLTVGGYIIHKDKVLLIHHRKLDCRLCVGGHIESNETPDEAILREIREEVGIDVKILNQSNIPLEGNVKCNLAIPFYINIHSVGNHDHYCMYYVCQAVNPEQLHINNEVKNFDRFTRAALDQKHVRIDVKNQALKAFEVYEQCKKV